jgi:hypothetical protein
MPVPAQHGHALKLTVDAMVHLRVAMTFHDPSGLRVVELLVTLANQDLASRDLSQLTRVCGLRARNEHLDELTRLDLGRGHSRRRRAGE